MRRPICLLVLLLLLTFSPINAQDETVISLVMPEFIANNSSIRTTLDDFESQNPGIRVAVVNDSTFVPPPLSPSDMGSYLDSVRSYVQRGDVFLADTEWILPAATRAGYLLDLKPLAEMQLDTDDYLPYALESVQWDGGMWMMPSMFDVVAVIYDPAVFDEAGLTYPDATWTMADFDNAARLLTTDDTPGMSFFTADAFRAFTRSLLSADVADDTTLPAPANFTDAALPEIVATMAAMENDGVLVMPTVFSGNRDASILIDTVLNAAFDDVNEIALLPDASVGIVARGFDISSGTSHPEAAYTLVEFLSTQPKLSNGSTYAPARSSSGNENAFGPRLLTESQIEVISQGLENPLTAANLRYINYLPAAFNQDIAEVEAATNTALDNALDRRDQAVVVDPPPERPQAPEGTFELTVTVISSVSPLSTASTWQRAARSFVEDDPEIGLVTIESAMDENVSNYTSTSDCIYSAVNYVPNGDLSLLANVDPLLQSDPAFDETDFLNGVLDQMTRDGQVWAVPMMIEPEVMWINDAFFEEAGVPFPDLTQGWTIDAFIDAINAVEEQPAVAVYNYGVLHLLMLVTAYGGDIVNTNTDPVSLNMTDLVTVDAIRQVLDLARNGQMTYEERGMSGSGITAIVVSSMDNSNMRGGRLVTMSSNPGSGFGGTYYPISYPAGLQVTPVSYQVGAMYISAESQHIEACYRFSNHMSSELAELAGMPARSSQLDDPEFVALRGEEQLDFYRHFAALLAEPSTVVIPSQFHFVLQHFMFNAFDAYVFDDADLETVLNEAQLLNDAFIGCLSSEDEGQDEVSEMLRSSECQQQVSD